MDAGKFVVGALILFGLIASVFLVFSDNLQLTRIGLVAALWAAAIGVLAATRYRREAAADKAKVRGLQTVYELQLEKEISARREYELGIEAKVREEVGADATELAALRAELAVLRESLQRLFDGELPVERPALRADAVRIQELPGKRANGNSPETDTWDAWSVPAVPRGSLTPVYESDHSESPVFASPDDDPVTAETAIVSPRPSDHLDAGPGDAGDAEDSVDADAQPLLTPSVGSRRRRRAEPGEDAPTRQLSVAEIMANLRSEQQNSSS